MRRSTLNGAYAAEALLRAILSAYRFRPQPDLQSTVSIGPRMAHVKDIDSFYNFIGYVVLSVCTTTAKSRRFTTHHAPPAS